MLWFAFRRASVSCRLLLVNSTNWDDKGVLSLSVAALLAVGSESRHCCWRRVSKSVAPSAVFRFPVLLRDVVPARFATEYSTTIAVVVVVVDRKVVEW